MQFCAAVPAPTGFQVAEALKDFFREKEKVAESQRRARRGMSHDPKSPLYSFSERSQASGMPELETAFQVSMSLVYESCTMCRQIATATGPLARWSPLVLDRQRRTMQFESGSQSAPNPEARLECCFSNKLLIRLHLIRLF